MKRALLCGALIAAAHTSLALDPTLAISQYGHTAWRVRDGAFSGPPTAIAQTADGYLWIGTESGLLRFDGVRFERWKPPGDAALPNDRIVKLLATSDGSLWIGTSSGVAQLKNDRLIVHATVGRFAALLEDREGTVWAGHTRNLNQLPPLCRLERGSFRCFGAPVLPFTYVGSLAKDARGDVWIGGDAGVCRWRKKRADCFPINELRNVADKAGVWEMVFDADVLLAVAGDFGMWRLESGKWVRDVTASSGDIEGEALLRDREGSLWIGTTERGLIRRIRGRQETFTAADGLSADSVGSVFEDREGNVWVATASGLDRFRDVKVVTFTKREGLATGTAASIAASRDGGIWVGTNDSVMRLNNGVVSILGKKEGFPGSAPTSLLEDSSGRLWVGVDNGLARLEGDRFTRVTMSDGSPVGTVTSIAEDRDGSIWVTTTVPAHGLVRIRSDTMVDVVDTTDATGFTALLANPGGGVWAGMNDSEIRAYRDGTRSIVAPAFGPRINWVRSLQLDSRGLWAVTTVGLRRIINGRSDILGINNGLPCTDIESLVTADDGSFWLKAACGLMRIPSEEIDAWSRQPARRVRLRLFDAFDGAHQGGMTPFTGRAAKSRDGRLWFVIYRGGLQMIDPAAIAYNEVPPPVRISGLLADRKQYEVARRVPLPALTKDLEIDYTALSYSVPERVRFRYRLEGADDEWIDAGTRRQAFYANLAPGAYRFAVNASNNDGVWSNRGAALEFSIPPAFHQTRTFLLICVLAALALIAFLVRWRIRVMHRRLQHDFEERLDERTKIARELHDRLLQGLVSTSLQLHVALEELPTEVQGRSRLERVQDLMGRVTDEGRRVLEGLRSEDTEDDLARALSHVSAEIDSSRTSKVAIVANGAARPLRLDIRDEIYQVAREALRNSLQHAQAKHIQVLITYGSRVLHVIVRDDGIGIDDEVLRVGREGHWGLEGMHERAGKIGAKLTIGTTKTNGTEIEIAVPAAVAYEDYRHSAWARLLLRLTDG